MDAEQVLREIHERLGILTEIKERLNKHDAVLFGNGQVGMVVEVARLRSESNACAAQRQNLLRGLWALVVAIVGNLGWGLLRK